MFFKDLTAELSRITLLLVMLLLTSCTSMEPRFDEQLTTDSTGTLDNREEYKISNLAPENTNVTTSSTTGDEGPLKVSVHEAILMAMHNNQGLVVERMNPPIIRTFEEEERAIFDPVFGSRISSARSVAERLSRAGSDTESSTVDRILGSVFLDTLFPTGTSLSLQGSTSIVDSSLYSDTFAGTRLGLTVTQALLQGADVRANTANIYQANVDTAISEYELRGFAELLLEEVESGYWDYALAQRQIEIYTESLNLAQKQIAEIRERIKIGKLAETELAAAQAEVALRRENLINARSDLAKERLLLLQLLNPHGKNMWDRQIILENQPSEPTGEFDDVEQHVKVALKKRADLNQARLEVQKGNLEVIKTKNGLLPKLDFFFTFGKTGYSNSFSRSVSNIDGDSYDIIGGLLFNYPPLNRSANARHNRAVITKQQSIEAVNNLAQIVQVDVRSAYIEVTRTKEQIAATTATRKFQEEKLRAEIEKFRVGKSTSLLAAQAQTDLVASQIAEIEAVVNYLKSLVNLHRMEGSLLERRGIFAHTPKTVILDDAD
ncbi:MAG: TolC family protein [Planctomycetota bacterium]|jgi:outer membrane protein TolC